LTFPKFFPGLYPRTPLKRDEKTGMRRMGRKRKRKGKEWQGRRGKGERKGEERGQREGGREGLTTQSLPVKSCSVLRAECKK
jgi:hypothetical protein